MPVLSCCPPPARCVPRAERGVQLAEERSAGVPRGRAQPCCGTPAPNTTLGRRYLPAQRDAAEVTFTKGDPGTQYHNQLPAASLTLQKSSGNDVLPTCTGPAQPRARSEGAGEHKMVVGRKKRGPKQVFQQQ